MMLTSGSEGKDIARCHELSIGADLIKPIKQSELLDSIRIVLKIEAPHGGELPHENAPTIGQRLRVLLAEDNEINQKLAVHHLKQHGHSVVIARSGHEALEAVTRDKFDLILMDVQMPKMSGFEATAEIRKAEQGGGTHIPIIAMTAHAMKGDEERCFAAGMDGYVSKPIQTARLYDEIKRVSAISSAAPSQTKSPPLDRQPVEPFDFAAALSQASNDTDLFKEIIGLFLDDYPRQMSAIKCALESGDLEAMSFAAHSLKGVVSNFRADAAEKAAQQIESRADRNDLTDIDAAIAELSFEIEGLARALTPLR